MNNQSAGKSVRILGIRIDAITKQELLARVGRAVDGGQRLRIATVNPEFIMAAQKDEEFRRVLEGMDVCVADGVGVLWAAKRMGVVLPEKITGSDFSLDLAAYVSERGGRLGLLGEREGVAGKAGKVLKAQYAGLEISLTYAGDGSEKGDRETVRQLREHPGDVLLVAYGGGKQEKWMERNLDKTDYKVAMGVGGTFLFIAGEVKRAPKWMQHSGLEWLFRLMIEPWRWKRQLALPRFVVAVLLTRIGLR